MGNYMLSVPESAIQTISLLCIHKYSKIKHIRNMHFLFSHLNKLSNSNFKIIWLEFLLPYICKTFLLKIVYWNYVTDPHSLLIFEHTCLNCCTVKNISCCATTSDATLLYSTLAFCCARAQETMVSSSQKEKRHYKIWKTVVGSETIMIFASGLSSVTTACVSW